MQRTLRKVFIYLARRDRRGIKVLTSFPSSQDEFPPTRIRDIKALGLPPAITLNLEQTIHQERMMWEPMMENAKDYGEFRKSLERRGFINVPMHLTLVHPIELKTEDKKQVKPVEITPIREQKKSMLRKKS